MDTAQVEIIGGAEGQTSIVIAPSLNWPLIIAVGMIIVIAVVGFMVWRKR